MSQLHYGDNLDVLREHVADESVDLIYLDPPFNSNAQYNILFKSPDGEAAEAQAEAFQDTWRWAEAAEDAYDRIMATGHEAAGIVRALRGFLGQSDMMAYLVMMTVRLIELRRTLKPTGSLYLHCDPTASHYLKIVLDGIFGPDRFLNELIWKRTNARGTTGKWPRIHDVLLCYTASAEFTFNPQKAAADSAKLPHTLITGPDGKKYQTFELTGPGKTRDGESGKAWRGYNPSDFGRHWGASHKQMERWDEDGLIHWPRNGGFPRRRAPEPFDPASRKVTVGDIWTDIDRLNQTAKERLGYPTQKPLALLERIIRASSKEGDVVLDPFCGCGTTVHAAQSLGRQWIGMDITHYAVTLIERRLKNEFPELEGLEVFGRPRDLASARKLAEDDPYQFQWWANWLVGVQNYRERKKGADRGIDGRVFFRNGPMGTGQVVVSVKAGQNIGVGMVRDLRGTIEREDAELGLLVTMAEPTRNMISEAATAGFVTTAHGRFPRVQVQTIKELLENRANIPEPYRVLPQEADQWRRGKKRQAKATNQLAFAFPFEGGKQDEGEVVHLDPSVIYGVRVDKERLL